MLYLRGCDIRETSDVQAFKNFKPSSSSGNESTDLCGESRVGTLIKRYQRNARNLFGPNINIIFIKSTVGSKTILVKNRIDVIEKRRKKEIKKAYKDHIHSLARPKP